MCYALKFTLIKLVLGDADEDCIYVNPNMRPPTISQMGFVTNPGTGIISLAFLPIFDTSWELPNMSLACALGASITGIIILQLRITELTSPLTVAVLGVFHDLGIVLFSLYQHKDEYEQWKPAQTYGYSVSILGVLLYACGRYKCGNQRTNAETWGREDSDDSISASVENDFHHHFSEDSRRQ